MSTYQRYLRERKEVQFEENKLDEENRLTRGMQKFTNPSRSSPLSPDDTKQGTKFLGQSKALEALKARRRDIKNMSYSDIKKYVFLAREAGETPPSDVLKRYEQITSKSTQTTQPSTSSSGFGNMSDKNPAMPSGSPESSTISSESIKGNTLSDLLKSAGISSASMTAIQSIKSSLSKALEENGLEIDPSFMV